MAENGRVSRLDDTDLDTALRDLPGWTRDGDAIATTYELDDFASAIAFVTRVGFLAEAADHHPDLDIRWRTVHVALTTHSEGGLTEKDITLALAIEGLGVR